MPSGFIYGNRYLSVSEQQNNADLIYEWMRGIQAATFSVNAACAIIANFEYESTINPGIVESLATDPEAFKEEHGYYPGCGLAGWTPYTKLTGWLNDTALPLTLTAAGKTKARCSLSSFCGSWKTNRQRCGSVIQA